MTAKNLLYLFGAVSLTVGRNIVSKKIATDSEQKAQFFFSQAILFGTAGLLLLVLTFKKATSPTEITIILGIIYGIFLILSQWMFTLALKNASTSICSVIYSLGFILPTISGAIFWNEQFTLLYAVGTILAIVLFLMSTKKDDEKDCEKRKFIPFIAIAMLSSGSLGILQKLQQSTKAANEFDAFLLIAFIFAFCCSILAFLLCKKVKLNMKNAVYPALAGALFGGANIFNTLLAGRIKSAVFFPIQNVSNIVFSTILGIIIFKEKLTKKTMTVLILGAIIIILFSI